jgi:hypothetical protein
MTEVHVIPDERTTWRVVVADAAAPLSEHTNATEAEFAARSHAQHCDAERVRGSRPLQPHARRRPVAGWTSAREQRARAR